MSDMLGTLHSLPPAAKVWKITAANFEDWLDLIKTVLLSKGLWKHANGSAVCALGQAEEYEREDAKVAAYLKVVVGSEQLIYVRVCYWLKAGRF